MTVRTPEEWALYVREAHSDAVFAIIEVGRRLEEAHTSCVRFWGEQTWENWCSASPPLGVGWSVGHVSLLRTIGSLSDLAEEARVLLPTASRTLHHLAILQREQPDTFAERLADGGINAEMTRDDAQRLRGLTNEGDVRRAERRERDRQAAEAEAALRIEDINWLVEEADFRSWEPPGKASLIFTDPPYGEEYLDLYASIPERANHWLNDEGWCAVMTGIRWLPKVMEMLSGGPLEYVWTFGLAHNQSRANGIQFLHVQNIWKPVILLRKGNQTLREWTSDLIHYEWDNTARVEALHRWQQEVSPLQKLIRAMTSENDLIIDPFCGSGTTGIAALSTKRRFASCDTDRQAIETAGQQLRHHVNIERQNEADREIA